VRRGYVGLRSSGATADTAAQTSSYKFTETMLH
jgi:hypothetical protein